MDKNRFRLEFIITYNKEIYSSENPNEESLKLIRMGKYRKQNIYSLSLNRIQLNDFLNSENEVIEYIKHTEEHFDDIWKVSMCVYNNGNDWEEPKWYYDCNGKIFGLENKLLTIK